MLCIFAAFIVASARLWPRWHCGCPTSRGELSFYTKAGILSRKDHSNAEAKETLIHRLQLTHWFGLSTRGRPRWFLGLIIWKQTEPRP